MLADHVESPPAPAQLLEQFLPQLLATVELGEFVDLACGAGQNGLLLAQHGARVCFADRNEEALQRCQTAIERLPTAQQVGIRERVRYWPVDLEVEGENPLAGQSFAAVLVFRYLHRPLIPFLKQAIKPGGLLVYETFTVANRQFGRPNNERFLLQPGELGSWFADWQILHSEELLEQQPVPRAVAQLVARKPG